MRLVTQVPDGLGQAAAALPDLARQQAGLEAQVASGAFRLTPEAATAAAKVCRDAIAGLDDALAQHQAFTFGFSPEGFGDCLIGRAFAGKIARKARQVQDLVKQAQQVLENMAQAYEASGKRTQQADEDNAGAFRGHT